MATDTTLAAITEQQNILRQKAAAARTAANNAATDEERAKFQAERDSYNAQIKTLTAQAETATKQDPATSTYAGTDANSGKDKYYNPVTGTMSLSDTPPTDAQKATFANTVNQSGTPVDPTNAATATPPAAATASLPVDINQTAALTEGQVSNVGAQNIKEQVGPPAQTEVVGEKIPNVIVNQPELLPLASEVPNPNTTARDIQPVVLGSDPAPGTASQILTPAESIAKAQENPDDEYGQNAAATLRKGQSGDVINTSNTPISKEKPPPDNFQSQNTPSYPEDKPKNDWRIKLALANNSTWSKKWFGGANPTILSPLATDKGVIFPYTPTIQMGYKANYDNPEITHTNYRLNFYKNSYVDDISITADFTAQDTIEANYLLATIHFFKTVTKMFYGKDTDPMAGTPPPILFLSGYGKYQFDKKPLLLSSFTFTLPNDVDYIRTNTDSTWSGTSINRQEQPTSATNSPAPKSPVRDWLSKTLRLESNSLAAGAEKPAPLFTGKNLNNNDSTYVPTKIQISLTLKPLISRFDMTNFGTNDYATFNKTEGMW